GGDVLLEEVAQLRGREVALLQPGRVLVVPHQGVPAHHLAVSLGEVHDGVRVGEVVGVRGGAQIVPLHLVLGRERGELAREHLAIGLVGGERVRVVRLRVVPAAGDGAADLQGVARGEGEGVLLRQAGRGAVSVARGLLRACPPARGGGGRGGGGHRGGDRSGGEDLAASHGLSFDVIVRSCSAGSATARASAPRPRRPTGRWGL